MIYQPPQTPRNILGQALSTAALLLIFLFLESAGKISDEHGEGK
ncbi:MAG: hypothetical protein OXD38_05620 [Aestuariivita sp.]|nr:hypothetical protein [Aestuariivita sp.]